MQTVQEGRVRAPRHDRIHFGMIRFVHETLYGIFMNPYSRLTRAGLKTGQQVLEVGCGPGFFTLPAAEIVGEAGHVYALDISPAAVEHVRSKIAQGQLSNVEVKLADANKTDLPNESIDVAFLFGVLLAFKNVAQVLAEMHRVLRAKGILSIQSGLPRKKLQELVGADGLFQFRREMKGVFVFEKASHT